jgi:hypothetical protein
MVSSPPAYTLEREPQLRPGEKPERGTGVTLLVGRFLAHGEPTKVERSMTLVDSAARRRLPRLTTPKPKHQRKLAVSEIVGHADDYRVIPWREWYRSKGISKDTARRLRNSGKGPRTVELSERLRGVTVKDDREWTESRIRGGV